MPNYFNYITQNTEDIESVAAFYLIPTGDNRFKLIASPEQITNLKRDRLTNSNCYWRLTWAQIEPHVALLFPQNNLRDTPMTVAELETLFGFDQNQLEQNSRLFAQTFIDENNLPAIVTRLRTSTDNEVVRDILNHVIAEGPNAGLSVAFWLACTNHGQALLAANHHRLANLINQETLNQVITQGPNAGLSVAYELACTDDGQALLVANHHRLANLINQETLNQVITQGRNAGQSVAWRLAMTPISVALLAINHYRLANLINQQTVNQVITEGPDAGKSVAAFLAMNPGGAALLAANHHRLANLITLKTLNHVITEGPYAGRSVAFWLAANPEGQALLTANQNYLANRITLETLNYVIPAGPLMGHSVASYLSRNPTALNPYRLFNLTSRHAPPAQGINYDTAHNKRAREESDDEDNTPDDHLNKKTCANNS